MTVVIPSVDGKGTPLDNSQWEVGFKTRPRTSNSGSWFLVDQASFVPSSFYGSAYGCVNKANVAFSVDFGRTDQNINCVQDLTALGPGKYDAGNRNIQYRELKADKELLLKIPAFNLEVADRHWAATPMLLEIMFKDSHKPAKNYDMRVYSGLFYPTRDRNIPYGWKSLEWPTLIATARTGTNQWRYFQVPFAKHDFSLLRAEDGYFHIRIKCENTNLPIDYVTLHAVSEDDYNKLISQQRKTAGFIKVALPEDAPDTNLSYADPNMTVFVRDFMRPVYKHTKPAMNEPSRFEIFGALNELVAATFSIYSKEGVSDLTVEFSDLTQPSGDSISARDISVFKFKDNLCRLNPGTSIYKKSYARVPDWIEEFSALNVAADTSERILLKIQIPRDVDPGIYSGRVIIKEGGVIRRRVPIVLEVMGFELDPPKTHFMVYHDPYYRVACSDVNEVFRFYRQVGFEPIIYATYPDGYQLRLVKDGNRFVGWDSSDFRKVVSKYRQEGFARDFARVELWSLYSQTINHCRIKTTDSDLWFKLSTKKFIDIFSSGIREYLKVAKDYNMAFAFNLTDEPAQDALKRIATDRVFTVIRKAGALTITACYMNADQECDVVSKGYNMPDNSTVPSLLPLVDYPIMSIDDYNENSQNFCFGAGGTSRLRNPIYGRFIHGLFSFRTKAAVIENYAMADFIGDIYNHFDGRDPRNFSTPDYIFAYPTWDGKLKPTLGAEGVREGIIDARYIATLQNRIARDPDNAVAVRAKSFLDNIYHRVIEPARYRSTYFNAECSSLGFYNAILEDISENSDPKDFDAFTKIRKQLADFITRIDAEAEG